ncbi:MAG: hypothetical protein JW384_03012 [Nitrosomonadaceae bacterium]|nr:hypothetical protein [Nitrosomonadaceae bacterium]
MKEKSFQDECEAYLTHLKVYHVVTWGNAWERRGRPDIYICHKGRFIGCELKKGTEEHPSPLQLKHLREIKDSGGIGVWITSLEELQNLLRSLD